MFLYLIFYKILIVIFIKFIYQSYYKQLQDLNKLFGNKDVNSQSSIYFPNLLDVPFGIYNAMFNMQKHDVTNPDYIRYLIKEN